MEKDDNVNTIEVNNTTVNEQSQDDCLTIHVDSVTVDEMMENDNINNEEVGDGGCLYCDDHDLDVIDLKAFTEHLMNVHSVSKNAKFLAQLTIDNHKRGGSVQPKLPDTEEIESDDEDDILQATTDKTETKSLENKEKNDLEEDGTEIITISDDDTNENKASKKDDDAVSDLSLSDDNIDKPEKAVVDKDTEKPKKTTKKSNKCTKCDVTHALGQRCVFILKTGSSNRGRGKQPSNSRGRMAPNQKVRTLPPELYNRPYDSRKDYERNVRDRSPVQRRAPTPPSAFERERDRFMADMRGSRHLDKAACKFCENTDHQAQQCPSLFCHVCNQQGHFAKDCKGPTYNFANPPPSAISSSRSSTMESSSYYQPTSAPPPSSSSMNPLLNTSLYNTPPPPIPSKKPPQYAATIQSLQPLKSFMTMKLRQHPDEAFSQSYIDLLVTNIVKMFAQANLNLASLESTFFSHGEPFLRSRISRELQFYAERFPGGVNMPLITDATVEYLKTEGGLGRQFSY